MAPKKETKILGVVMDSKLRFKNHVKKVLSKELRAALALERIYIITLNIA